MSLQQQTAERKTVPNCPRCGHNHQELAEAAAGLHEKRMDLWDAADWAVADAVLQLRQKRLRCRFQVAEIIDGIRLARKQGRTMPPPVAGGSVTEPERSDWQDRMAEQAYQDAEAEQAYRQMVENRTEAPGAGAIGELLTAAKDCLGMHPGLTPQEIQARWERLRKAVNALEPEER